MFMGNSQIKKANTLHLGEPDVLDNKEVVSEEVENDEQEEDENDEQEEDENDEQEEDENAEQEEDENDEQEEDENAEQYDQVETAEQEEVIENEEQDDQVENNEQEQIEIPLSSIPVNDKNGAFQLLIAFINLAYARGAFKQDEVEKIIECINKFLV
jgi:hypothetical protein